MFLNNKPFTTKLFSNGKATSRRNIIKKVFLDGLRINLSSRNPIAKKPNILNATVNSITPDEGLLVLFPSYLDHSVKPNLSSNQRIVISFNVNLINK